MNSKAIIISLAISIAGILTVVASCTGISRYNDVADAVFTERNATESSRSFEPMETDNSATANAVDVLIPASVAKKAPEIATGKWMNSEPLTLEGLRGRVVYIEFWTFGCSNCINTLPT
ncbi:MAG: hypothetical protein WBD22_01560, partial [Pyrinomonadaceae bacterium]